VCVCVFVCLCVCVCEWKRCSYGRYLRCATCDKKYTCVYHDMSVGKKELSSGRSAFFHYIFFPRFWISVSLPHVRIPYLRIHLFISNQFHILYTCKITTATGWQPNCNLLLLLLYYTVSNCEVVKRRENYVTEFCCQLLTLRCVGVEWVNGRRR